MSIMKVEAVCLVKKGILGSLQAQEKQASQLYKWEANLCACWKKAKQRVFISISNIYSYKFWAEEQKRERQTSGAR
jgi:hypothetical protein